MNCDELQQLTAVAALGALDAPEADRLRERLEGDVAARAELSRFLNVVGALAAVGPGRRPSASVRAKVLAQIRQTPQAPRVSRAAVADSAGVVPPAPAVPGSGSPPDGPAGIEFITKDSPWLPAPVPGVRFKLLSAGPHQTHAILLLELRAGALYPEHDHFGTEDMYVLTGDLQNEGRSLGPGDFLHAEPGSHHHELRSIGGCTALMVVPKATLQGMVPAEA